MGGDVRIDPAGFDIGIRDCWQQALESVDRGRRQAIPDPRRRLRPSARRPRASPTGCARSAAQEAELGLFFDHVIVCTVTGSTHAGMIAGFALEGRADRRVIGIDASATMEQDRSTR